eukprot:CAMPEP_0115869414 /NCGR_PEP_ID=MMETSP0287-20121206/21798_1 /TAXON_ID=412157 /ORGANISM="Chrysochromulina rotalis, Strain UIO044" /LENGTH=252 /DNA_ID=CAMNT_0003324103 /DNA_START=212 /DNA_END=969 /DNA_ORIENTATION=-
MAARLSISAARLPLNSGLKPTIGALWRRLVLGVDAGSHGLDRMGVRCSQGSECSGVWNRARGAAVLGRAAYSRGMGSGGGGSACTAGAAVSLRRSVTSFAAIVWPSSSRVAWEAGGETSRHYRRATMMRLWEQPPGIAAQHLGGRRVLGNNLRAHGSTAAFEGMAPCAMSGVVLGVILRARSRAGRTDGGSVLLLGVPRLAVAMGNDGSRPASRATLAKGLLQQRVLREWSRLRSESIRKQAAPPTRTSVGG